MWQFYLFLSLFLNDWISLLKSVLFRDGISVPDRTPNPLAKSEGSFRNLCITFFDVCVRSDIHIIMIIIAVRIYGLVVHFDVVIEIPIELFFWIFNPIDIIGDFCINSWWTWYSVSISRRCYTSQRKFSSCIHNKWGNLRQTMQINHSLKLERKKLEPFCKL